MKALYSLYNALVSINVPADKAQAVVDAMEHDMTTLLATKSDLASTQLLLKKDIDYFHASLKKDFDASHASLKKDIDASHASLKKDIDTVQAFLKQHIDASVELLRSSMTVRLGSMMVVLMGLLFAALKLT